MVRSAGHARCSRIRLVRGRVAKVVVIGVGVREVIRIYKGVERNEAKIKKWMPHVSSAQLKAALLYYTKFRQEVEAEIADNEVASAEGQTRESAIARRL
jgi:uncharacterized protein (DUF433 family)